MRKESTKKIDDITEDNPWTFYVGIGMAFYGLMLFFTSGPHNVEI